MTELRKNISDPVFNPLRYSHLIDLSHAIDPDMPLWPGDPPTEFATIADGEIDSFYLRKISIGEHTGTHITAPITFHPSGRSIDELPAESLIAPGITVDIRRKTSSNPDYRISISDLVNWERKYGPISEGCIILALTGWSQKWNNPEKYLGQNAKRQLHFPGFSLEATHFLLDSRKINGLGIDTHGIDPGEDNTFSVSKLMLEEPRIVLANLTNLHQLPPTGFTLIIGTLKLRGGSGSPAAVLALIH